MTQKILTFEGDSSLQILHFHISVFTPYLPDVTTSLSFMHHKTDSMLFFSIILKQI